MFCLILLNTVWQRLSHQLLVQKTKRRLPIWCDELRRSMMDRFLNNKGAWHSLNSLYNHTLQLNVYLCVWSPCGWAGRVHCVPVNLCKCGSLLMAGQWLCTNGCRCVDGGRTSLVTVLISGCAQGVIPVTPLLQEEHAASNDNTTLPSSLDLHGKKEWGGDEGRNFHKGWMKDENSLSRGKNIKGAADPQIKDTYFPTTYYIYWYSKDN